LQPDSVTASCRVNETEARCFDLLYSPAMSRVTDIDAGNVGACCARYLALAGHEVTLVDRHLPGMGCSFGNAGWI
jgi:FAD dependent oxidoreductase